MNFGEKLFQTKLLSRLSHKVCRLLPSPVLLRKFTIENKAYAKFGGGVGLGGANKVHYGRCASSVFLGR